MVCRCAGNTPAFSASAFQFLFLLQRKKAFLVCLLPAAAACFEAVPVQCSVCFSASGFLRYHSCNTSFRLSAVSLLSRRCGLPFPGPEEIAHFVRHFIIFAAVFILRPGQTLEGIIAKFCHSA